MEHTCNAQKDTSVSSKRSQALVKGGMLRRSAGDTKRADESQADDSESQGDDSKTESQVDDSESQGDDSKTASQADGPVGLQGDNHKEGRQGSLAGVSRQIKIRQDNRGRVQVIKTCYFWLQCTVVPPQKY